MMIGDSVRIHDPKCAWHDCIGVVIAPPEGTDGRWKVRCNGKKLLVPRDMLRPTKRPKETPLWLLALHAGAAVLAERMGIKPRPSWRRIERITGWRPPNCENVRTNADKA